MDLYPEWHRKPLKLSCKEMEDPLAVLHDFFTCYSLTGVRTSLHRWLVDSLRTSEEDAAEYLELNDALQKLIEAAWIIQQQQMAEPANAGRRKKKK